MKPAGAGLAGTTGVLIGFWLFGVVSFTASLSPVIGDDVSAFLLAVLCFLLGTPLLVALRRRSLDLCEPVFYTAMIMALAYPAQVLYALIVASGPFTDYGRVWLNPETLRRCLLYSVIGSFSYLATYYASARRMARLTMPWLRLPEGPLTTGRILAVYGLGWSIRLYMILSGNFATFYNWSGFDPQTAAALWTVAQLPWLAYVLSWLDAVGPNASFRSRVTLAVIVVMEGLYHLTISASKTFLALLILYPILAVSLRRRRLPGIPLVAFSAAFILFVFPFVVSQRELQESSGPDVGRMRDRVDIAREATTMTTEGPGGSEQLRTRIELALSRWHGFDSLSAVMLRVPDQIEFIYFEDVVLIPTALIPRAVAPWKPVATLSLLFADKIFGGSGGVSPFPIAEGYINAGVVGIVVLMSALALVQNWFYRGFLLPRASQPLAAAIYLYLFFGVTNLDSSLLLGWIGSLQSAAVVSVVVLAIFSTQARRRRGG